MLLFTIWHIDATLSTFYLKMVIFANGCKGQLSLSPQVNISIVRIISGVFLGHVKPLECFVNSSSKLFFVNLRHHFHVTMCVDHVLFHGPAMEISNIYSCYLLLMVLFVNQTVKLMAFDCMFIYYQINTS